MKIILFHTVELSFVLMIYNFFVVNDFFYVKNLFSNCLFILFCAQSLLNILKIFTLFE
jgi:hypothetical protein